MGLIDTLRTWVNGPQPARSWGYDLDYANLVQGYPYPLTNLNLTLPGGKEEEIENNFDSYALRGYKSNSVIFACMATRMLLFSEARFQYQRMVKGRPGDLFGDASLDILEHPWPNGVTGDLLTRAITDVDLAGNFYATRRRVNGVDRIVRMRPDWVTMVFGSNDPDVTARDLDAEFLGIIYYPGGENSGAEAEYLQRSQVVHFALFPDPQAVQRGMSWLTPVVREVMADSAATAHKLKFFENGATPQMIVKRPDAPSKEAFKEWREIIEMGHAGAANAYRTLYLTAGADATVVGKDLQQIEFKATQGAGETRIAAAARVHPAVVGLSEGMQGASLNAGNFAAARRLVADGFARPAWRNFAGSMETLVPPPAGSRLWYDDRDIAFLREDRKDAAEIQRIKSATIRQYVDSGFLPESVIKAVEAENPTLLKHSGLFSVQLQKPGVTPTATSDTEALGESNGVPANPEAVVEASP
jgi:phage portal protein BeeE